MANSNDTKNVVVTATPEALTERKSALEETYEAFSASLIRQSRETSPITAQLMTHLNRVQQLCAGMGVVMRIVSGNVVLKDSFDPEDANMEPPLSDCAISGLSIMVAAVCETITDEIAMCADTFDAKVSA